MDNDLKGVVFGIDRATSAGWRFGISGGYDSTKAQQAVRTSSGTVDTYSVGAYGGYGDGPAKLSFGGFYNWHEIDTSRTVTFPGVSQSLTASYSARSWQAFAEANYQMPAGDVLLEPVATASYIGINTDGFSETGGTAALTAASSTQHAAFTTVGLRASMDLGPVKVKTMAGWRHVFGDAISSTAFTLAGSPAFTVTGAPIARDALIAKAGFEASVSDNITLGSAYTGQYGTGTTAHGANGTLRVVF